ncbi:unnamed protein product [Medioppia subpectinata]|uniref:Major facilitator superfamily associated domain-containing protein n=1 Tax=Medioppia subpectinata TaxID=1979941 RepID=A0A7R9KNE7_9ACAR|nr:unnamed protein product [Medioppia subpectinata]CAG2106468.1 unnamed protein product [Medioppia subpectinata]
MSLKAIERKRNGLNVVNCFFYSALACIVPYLSSHMREIGITKIQSAWITSIVALISMIGPLCLGPIAYKYNKYKTILVLCLLISFTAYTALLFVPKVIITERQPKIYFDCSDNILRIEQCPNWEGQCHTYAKRPATNFSNFQLTGCTYECPYSGTVASPGTPITACFQSTNEMGSVCKEVNPKDGLMSEVRASRRAEMTFRDNYSETESSSMDGSDVVDTKPMTEYVQFDARFDRWPVIDTPTDDIVSRVFAGQLTCTYKPAPPLLFNQKLFDTISCKPYVHNCNVYCHVNLRHRTKSSRAKDSSLRPPTPCLIETGDPKQTFYSYLLIRSLADFSLFTAYTLLDALSVAMTNDFDSIYGGFSKLWALMIPMIAWPPIVGQLVDTFSTTDSPNYAPPIIVFDGLVIITAFLVVMMPLSPINMLSKSISQQLGKGAPIVPTNESYPRQHSKGSAICRLLFLFPLILILGSEWGLLETFLHPFYVNMKTSKLWIGLTFTAAFGAAAPFTLIAKSLINGVGRVNLIILAFIFYSLRFGGISFLLYPKLLIIPFEMMEAFTLPIAWIGITSYCHHLIRRSPNASTYATGTIYQKYSSHIILQYTLNLVHFGGGRALGAIIGGVWLLSWPHYNEWWYWLNDLDVDYAEGYTYLEDGFRVLLRLTGIISVITGLIVALIYHCICAPILCSSKKKKSKPQQPVKDNSPAVVLNGNYSRLLESQQTENVQMRQNQIKSNGSQQTKNNCEPRIKMADEDIDDEEILLNNKV